MKFLFKINFLSCPSWPLAPHCKELINPLALFTDLSHITPAVSGAHFSGFTAPGFPKLPHEQSWSMISSAMFHCKTTSIINTGAFIHYVFLRKKGMLQLWGTQQQKQPIPEMMMNITREQSSQNLWNIQGNFKTFNGSCLPHTASSKPGFFMLLEAGFRGTHSAFPMLLTAGRIITGTQQIITPMIGHEVRVGEKQFS